GQTGAMDCSRRRDRKTGLPRRKRYGPPRPNLPESAPGTLAQTKDHSSHRCVIYNLDSNHLDVYCESNLIEARAAAILTPHLMRHAPAVFLGLFLFRPKCLYPEWSKRPRDG